MIIGNDHFKFEYRFCSIEELFIIVKKYFSAFLFFVLKIYLHLSYVYNEQQ